MMFARLIWGLPKAKENKQPPVHLEKLGHELLSKIG
jgi:hypothetical protein